MSVLFAVGWDRCERTAFSVIRHYVVLCTGGACLFVFYVILGPVHYKDQRNGTKGPVINCASILHVRKLACVISVF